MIKREITRKGPLMVCFVLFLYGSLDSFWYTRKSTIFSKRKLNSHKVLSLSLKIFLLKKEINVYD